MHLAVTRGDLTLCRKLLRRKEDVFAMDSNRDTAIHIACLAGRQLIVRDLIEMGALIHEKNRDLMSPLQLAVVDEAQGNGEVVRMLIEAGCNIDAKCWDITPLMAAASGGHHWALEVLLEIGADTMVRNGYEMMALDYARDQATAEVIYDFMRGFFLPDQGMLKRQEASRQARRKNTMNPPGMGRETEDKPPRAFQAIRVMSLDSAFRALNLPLKWLPSFKADGTHFAEIRRKWRQMVLDHHPDRLPSTLTAEAQAEHTAVFTMAMAAFEAIDAFYTKMQSNSIGKEDAKSAASEHSSNHVPHSGSAPAVGCGPQHLSHASSTLPSGKCQESECGDLPAAQARAARPLLYKQRVCIVGLQARQEYNGRTGIAKMYDRNSERYGVELDEGGGSLKVRERHLQLVCEEPVHADTC